MAAEAILEARRRSASKVDLLSWMMSYRKMLAPGRPFDVSGHKYLKAIYECSARDLIIYKASQMGASEYAISYALYSADIRHATVLYVLPTDTHASDFSSARLGPALEASTYLNNLIAKASQKRGADRITLKRIRDRFIYLRGGQVRPNGSAPQLKGIDADVLVVDELDEMDPRAPDIVTKRLGHSEIAESRLISTPTYSGMGIHARWLESDQREWFVRCDFCNEAQPLCIDQVVIEWDQLGRPVRWNGMQDGSAFVACKKCGRALDRLAAGEWVATYPSRERELVGFHLTKLFSSKIELVDIIRALQTVNETKMRECFNQDLGVPYVPRGEQLTDDVLDMCRRDYIAHVAGERTYLGADVGKTIHVVIRGQRDETGERPLRFIGEVESFEEVGRLIRMFHVERAVVDALPETRKARELQANFPPGKVWLAYYQAVGAKSADAIRWVGEDKRIASGWNGIVELDRTRTLDETIERFFLGQNVIPVNARDIPDYYSHLKALVRVVEKSEHSAPVARYVKSGPDHFAHAENYCMVASHSPAVRRGGTWGRSNRG